MFKRILISLVIIPILFLLVYGYLRLRSTTSTIKDSFYVLPNECVVLLEWHGYKKLDKYFESKVDSSFSNHILKLDFFKQCFKNIKNNYKQLAAETSLVKQLDNSNIYSALYKTTGGNYDWFFCTSVPREIDNTKYLNFMATAFSSSKPKLENDIFELITPQKIKIYFYIQDGIISISKNKFLVKQSWVKLMAVKKEEPESKLNSLMKLSITNNLVNAYANISELSSCLSNYIEKSDTLLGFSSHDFDWISADIELEKDYLFASGLASSKVKNKKFIEPVKFEMAEIIPANFASVEWSLKSSSTDSNIVNKYLGNEIAVVKTKPLAYDLEFYTYQIISFKKGVQLYKCLQELDTTIHINPDVDSIYSLDYSVSKKLFPTLNLKNGVKLLQSKNYVIAAKTKSALIKYKQQIVLQNVLSNNMNYNRCRELVFSKSNRISIYSPTKYARYLQSNLKPLGKNLFTETEKWFSKNQFIYVGISNNGNAFMQNIYLSYEHKPNISPNLAWRLALPKIENVIKLHSATDSSDYIACKSSNAVNIISADGKLVKKILVTDSIIGNIQSLKSSKSSNIYCLFNTSTRLFLYDAKGDIMKGFPIALSSNSIQSPTVFYNSNSEARIIVNGKNNKLAMYDAKGKLIDDFKSPTIKENINIKIEKIQNSDNTLYIGFNEQGNYFALTAKGKNILKKDSLKLTINDLHDFTVIDEKIAIINNSNYLYLYNARNTTLIDSVLFSSHPYDLFTNMSKDNVLYTATASGIFSFNIISKKVKHLAKIKLSNGKLACIVNAGKTYYCFVNSVDGRTTFFDNEFKVIEDLSLFTKCSPVMIDVKDDLKNSILVKSNSQNIEAVYINEK